MPGWEDSNFGESLFRSQRISLRPLAADKLVMNRCRGALVFGICEMMYHDSCVLASILGSRYADSEPMAKELVEVRYAARGQREWIARAALPLFVNADWSPNDTPIRPLCRRRTITSADIRLTHTSASRRPAVIPAAPSADCRVSNAGRCLRRNANARLSSLAIWAPKSSHPPVDARSRMWVCTTH